MIETQSQKKTFLLISPDPDRRRILIEGIERHLRQVVVFYAVDGQEGYGKLENAPPNILVLDDHLDTDSSHRIVDKVLAKKKFDKMAMILVAEIPEKEQYVEEVALGRIHYLSDISSDEVIGKCLARALNFLESDAGPREFKVRYLGPGDVLIREGEKAESVYIVKNGNMRAYTVEGGKEVSLGNVETGDFVGEMAYVTGEPRSAFVSAITNCELIEIPIDHLDSLLFKKPAWSKALLRTLSRRLKESNRRIIQNK